MFLQAVGLLSRGNWGFIVGLRRNVVQKQQNQNNGRKTIDVGLRKCRADLSYSIAGPELQNLHSALSLRHFVGLEYMPDRIQILSSGISLLAFWYPC